MRSFKIFALFAFLGIIILSCSKNVDYNPQGGELPTNYIMVQDSGFSPAMLTVVGGSSITFVNNTGIPHRIRTADSITIPPVTIENNSSFFFKKDTAGTFPFYCETHPVATGVIIITP